MSKGVWHLMVQIYLPNVKRQVEVSTLQRKGMLEGQYVCVLKRQFKTCYYKLPISCCLDCRLFGNYENILETSKTYEENTLKNSTNGNHQKLGVVIHKSLSNFWKCGNMTAGKRTYEKMKYHCVLFLILPSSLPLLSTGILQH